MLGVPQKGGAGPLAPMDPWAAVRWYVVVKALGSVPGMKVMLLDSATAATVSLVCSQSQALEHQVYHVDKLGNPRARRLGGFRALVIVRPTPDKPRRQKPPYTPACMCKGAEAWDTHTRRAH